MNGGAGSCQRGKAQTYIGVLLILASESANVLRLAHGWKKGWLKKLRRNIYAPFSIALCSFGSLLVPRGVQHRHARIAI